MTKRVTGPCPHGAALMLAFASLGVAATGPVSARSQGPVVDGPYVGTLPCADCSGIRTTLTLYTLGEQDAPLAYRMTTVYLDTPDGDRTEERLGPWTSLDRGPDSIVRIEPSDDQHRRSFRRAGPDRLVLLNRQERSIDTRQNVTLERDAKAEPTRLPTPRTLFQGWLTRDFDMLLLTACDGGETVVVRDVSPESVITAAMTDVGFDDYDTLYLEAWGSRRDGELHVDRLNRAGRNLDCPESTVRFSAHGRGASWSLESGPDRTTFTGAGSESLNAPPLPLSWRWPGGRQDRAEAMLSSSTEAGTMTVRLHPKICRDTDAEAVYGFTSRVTVTRGGPATDYSGCAYLGNEPLY